MPRLDSSLYVLRADGIEDWLEWLGLQVGVAAESLARHISGVDRAESVSIFRVLETPIQASMPPNEADRWIEAIAPERGQPWLKPKQVEFVRNNVSMIKTVAREHATKVEQLVLQHAQSGMRPETLQRKLVNQFDLSEGRAKTIASDQIFKYHSDVRKARMQSYGLEFYEWNTSGDHLVRDAHEGLDGMICRWDNPSVWSTDGKNWTERPSTVFHGEPGEDYNCRCTAEMWIMEVFDESLDDE